MTDLFNLTGKNIIITGASSGIGKECAIKCASRGANVILLARKKDKLDELVQALPKGRAFSYPVDLLKFEDYKDLITRIVNDHGKLYGLVHSAGTECTIPLNSLKPSIYNHVYNLNVVSFYELTKYISKKKNRTDKCSIIAISSVMGSFGEKGKLAYCSSKSALINGVKSLSLELASKHIRVNAISPGIVKTKMVEELFASMNIENVKEIEKRHPLGFGSPEDIANASIYLLSEASNWITGSNLIIDGGYSAG